MTTLNTNDDLMLLDAFNEASDEIAVLNAIDTYEARLLEFGSESQQHFRELPDDAGRQKAIGLGLKEIADLFGGFTSVDELKAALDHQIAVEYAKYQFINAINGASAEEMGAIVAHHVEILDGHRQALIAEWGAVLDNEAVAARVVALQNDSYTTVLHEIAGRLDNTAFMSELGARLFAARGEAGGQYFGVYPLVEAIDNAREASDVILDAFNGAPDELTVLAAIDAYEDSLLVDGSVSEAHFRALPDDAGRQKAIGLGLMEIADLFGGFKSVTELKAALDHQIAVEYAKYEFINALDAATTPEEMSAAILAHVGVVNGHRQALIAEWGAIAGNEAVAARVLALQSDAYTTVLADIAGRVGDTAFIAALGARLLAIRDDLPGDKFFGVTNIIAALDASNNHAPTAPAANDVVTDEDKALTDVVIGAADADNDALTYTIKAGAEPQKGVVTLANGTFTYTPTGDVNGTDTFTIQISDGNGGIVEQVVNVTIKPVNDAPTAVSLSAATVAENTKAGTVIGALGATDIDQGDTFTFQLLDSAGGRFAVQGNQLVVANSALLDYEQGTSHKVSVRVTDSGGATFDKIFDVAVTDVANEVATGTSGADKIVGGSGKDKLVGGAGKDILSGGKGKDTFVFNTKPDKKTNIDKITDFSVKDDSLWLDNAVFKKLGKKGTEAKPAQLSKDFFALGTKAQDANDYLIYNKKTGALYYDADGSGKGAAIQIATLSKNLAMTYKDFFVV